MVGFRDLVGTGIAPVSKKPAVKGGILAKAGSNKRTLRQVRFPN